MASNESENIIFEQPATPDGRAEIAEACQVGLKISVPILIDGLDDAVEEAYGGWPDRLYVVKKDGTIGYKGRPGPGGFEPREMEEALTTILAEQKGR